MANQSELQFNLVRKKILKNQREIVKHQSGLQRYLTVNKMRKLDHRRARTRTLIQLGGLVEKSGLANHLDIELGQDLQQDEECFEANAVLLGGLIEIKDMLKQDSNEQQKMLWASKGKEQLAKPA